MSDFLGNLIAKSIDSGEVVQPRPASLFEPSPLTNVSDAAEPLALEGVDDGSASGDIPGPTWPRVGQPALPPRGIARSRAAEPDPPDPGAPRTSVVQPVSQPADPPLPRRSATAQQEEMRPGPAPAQPGPKQTQAQSTPEPGPLVQPRVINLQPANSEPAPGPGRPKGQAKQASPRDVTEGDAKPHPEPAIQQVTVERIVTQPVAVATAPVTRSEAAHSDDGPKHESHRHVRVERMVGASVRPAPPARETKARPSHSGNGQAPQLVHPRPEPPPAQASPATIVAAPEVIPYLEPVAPPRSQTPAPEAGPSVQVTIGRVEVRATPAPAAPKKTRSRPPVMSLDEYLRQRSGGDRT